MNRYNFHQLLTEELLIHTKGEQLTLRIDGIQIPMIQRDYAQGRTEEKELRDRLLTALFAAMCAGETLELDFVYGAIKLRDHQLFFIPLDGQQRLTTLFLLHWYIGQRELDVAQLKISQAELSRFSYDTRPTARDFCRALCSLEALNFTETPAELIMGKSWFFSAYEKDPTVKSMLIMLDAIHNFYQKVPVPIYDQLSKLCFYILPLDGFGLTDELYIKMNARGKPLTDFENFKADLINWMNDEENTERDQFLRQVSYNNRFMPYAMAISLKLDNEWTNFFWSFTKASEAEKDKLVDPLFLRFFDRLALNRFIGTSALTQDALERSDVFSFFYSAEQRTEDSRYASFRPYHWLIGSFEMIQKMERVLDHISAFYQEISICLPPSWDAKVSWHFFDKDISQTQRILFLGMCSYLEQGKFELKSFQQWMRIVWNIIINPDIRSVQAMISAMKLISELGTRSTDIYTYLAGPDSASTEQKHRNTEFAEERQKAALIVADTAWEAVLIEGERHPLFLGSIGFLLYGSPSLSTFVQRLSIASHLFDGSGARGKFSTDHRLMRALIACIRRADDLHTLKMEDSQANWLLLLRRNQASKNLIGEFCESEDIDLLNASLSSAISAPSEIAWEDKQADYRRLRFTHEQLYQPADFHAWMQEANAVGLLRKDDHFYIKKYRAWYDMVMLDTLRNLVIDSLIHKYGLSTKHRCADTPFFWGYTVDLELRLGDFVITLHFDQHQTLFGGLTRSRNVSVPDMLVLGDSNEHWHWMRAFNYTAVKTGEEAVDLCESIGNVMFDVENAESLVSLLNSSVQETITL